jgi:nucleolar pre-ribosomal-associated protein 1
LLQSLFSTPKLLLESILSLFKEKFEICLDKGDLRLLLPNFYIVRTVKIHVSWLAKKIMSPVKLLELANCMFTKLDSCSTGSSAFIFAVRYIYILLILPWK